jgi:chromosome segregation protein
MYLKSLQIQGFKSFASKTLLEFPKGITAVVGPNGSGKSNLVESIRWVMGEQSMKSLRTKKSEDLIFSGSKKSQRQNKAEVQIVLDNKDRVFPLDFDEVVIARKVFRDGQSEYYLNNSQVRLRDVIEFLAKARIGVSGYSVISQGMADALLNASPAERKEMVDEALGLKEFQLKKKESIDKLNQTRVNIANIEGIIAELTPHMRFLKRQAAKLEQRNIIEMHLKDLVLFFCAKEQEKIKDFSQNFDNEKTDIGKKIEASRAELKIVEDDLQKEMQAGKSDSAAAVEKYQEDYNVWQDKKVSFGIQLGKIDSAIEAAQAKKERPEDSAVTISYVTGVLKNIYTELRAVAELNDLEEVKQKITASLSGFDGLFTEIQSGKKAAKPVDDTIAKEIEALWVKKEEARASLAEVDSKMIEIRNSIRALQQDLSKDKEKIFQLKDLQHEKQLLITKLSDELALIHEKERNADSQKRMFEEQMNFLNEEEKKLVLENQVFEKLSIKERLDNLHAFDDEGLRREIEKMKIRLEVAQDVDPEIQKEYTETQTRYEFLVNQLEDLKKSSDSLHEVINSLDEKIEEIFKEGFKVINEDFNKFFRMLFEGGKSSLIRKSQLSMKMKAKPEEGVEAEEESGATTGDDDEEEEEQLGAKNEGIEISVDLPKKKIHSVNMLSGGERTLTSIALLFAFVSYASPPFLVVDEVDAALDESNSFRFAKILHDLSTKTQFVAITHNRETMRHSDVLYGLTMDDNGISSILSLKFEETGSA